MTNKIIPIAIHDAMLQRLASVSERSRDRSDNPAEDPTLVRTKFEHWVAYTGSTYDDTIENGIDVRYSQDREMEFASYVRVQDLRRDHRSALELHETIMTLLNGWRPDLDGIIVRSPLRLKSDTLLPPRGEDSTFRYQALYRINVEATPLYEEGFLIPSKIAAALWRSPVDEVGNQNESSLFSISVVVKEDQ